MKKNLTIFFLTLISFHAYAAPKSKATAIVIHVSAHTGQPAPFYAAAMKVLAEENGGSFTDPWKEDQRHVSNVREIEKHFAELLRKGYSLKIYVDCLTDVFLSTLEDPNTVAIIHEGHGVQHQNDRSIVALRINDDLLDGEAIRQYLNYIGGSRDHISSSRNLKFFFTAGCFAAKCPSFYGDKLDIDPSIWIGSSQTINAFTVGDLVSRLSPLIKDLPAVSRSRGKAIDASVKSDITSQMAKDGRSLVSEVLEPNAESKRQLREQLLKAISDSHDPDALKYYQERLQQILEKKPSARKLFSLQEIPWTFRFPDLFEAYVLPRILDQEMDYYPLAFLESWIDDPHFEGWLIQVFKTNFTPNDYDGWQRFFIEENQKTRFPKAFASWKKHFSKKDCDSMLSRRANAQ